MPMGWSFPSGGFRVSTPAYFLITARGGSKGIPRKNLQLVGGIPLVQRSIMAAHESTITAEVIVSTDSTEIAQIARSCGAGVVMRPPELAEDDSPSEAALLHFLNSKGITSGKLVMIQPTSPFLRGEDLDAIVRTCETFDTCLTVTDFHGFVWRKIGDGDIMGINHDPSRRLRRQDLPFTEYLETGAACGMDIELFLNEKRRFFGRVGYVRIPKLRSLEIDSPEDLQLAVTICGLVDSGITR